MEHEKDAVTKIIAFIDKYEHTYLIGRHEVVARLDHVGQDVRHLPLLGRDVALQVAVERQEQQAVRAYHPRDEVHHQELHLWAKEEEGGGGGG